MEENGCDGVSATWAAHEGPPIAAEGATPPFELVEVLAARVGPFESDVTITELDIGAAPGWGCDTPAELNIGGWVGAVPVGNPLPGLLPSEVLAEYDLGDGFTARRVAFPGTLFVPAGDTAFVGFALTPTNCGAKAIWPPAGVAWRWRADNGWTELDGKLVLWASGCAD